MCGAVVRCSVLPKSQTEGETVNKTLEEPADAVDARVSLLLLQVSMKLVQFGHQDLTNTVVSAKLKAEGSLTFSRRI